MREVGGEVGEGKEDGGGRDDLHTTHTPAPTIRILSVVGMVDGNSWRPPIYCGQPFVPLPETSHEKVTTRQMGNGESFDSVTKTKANEPSRLYGGNLLHHTPSIHRGTLKKRQLHKSETVA